ncbi:Rab family GTPase [Sulfurimonas sp.]|uniref:Rab family GTPase n=1 Tax=Sulfurimonas sp. TaxID=2022749 RepID=UPI003D0AC867
MLAYKVVMVGDFGVGKTSLVKRYVENSFSEEYLSTIGVSISKKSLENATIMLWDIEGQTEFKPVSKQYLLGSKGFIVVADIHRQNTIDSIKTHIELCHSIVKDAPICIAFNKNDLPNNLAANTVDELYKISDQIINISFTSAKEDVGVNDIFTALNSFVTNSLGH